MNRAQGSGLRAQGSGLRAQGSGLSLEHFSPKRLKNLAKFKFISGLALFALLVSGCISSDNGNKAIADISTIDNRKGGETLVVPPGVPGPELFVPLLIESDSDAISAPAQTQAQMQTQAQHIAPLAAASYRHATKEQSQHIDRIQKERTTKSVSLTRVDAKALKEGNIQISLPGNKKLRVSRKHFEGVDENNFTWSGEISGTFASSTFVVSDGKITGSIRDENNQLYRIEHVGDDVHALTQIDESLFPPSAKPVLLNMPGVKNDAYLALASAATSANPVEIDVLVAFTPAARNAYTNIHALIGLAIEETNQSYRNSDIHIRLNWVDTVEFNYTEHSNWEGMLKDFAASPIINERRNASGADVAMLILNHSSYCGMAYMYPSATHAFGLVHYGCATGNYTFGHELGHIQGAGHNEQESSNPYFTYGHGYIHPSSTLSQNFRTIMAYACPGSSCPKIQHWSNPNKSHNGITLGTANKNNNARVLNETAAMVAGFRNRPVPPPAPIPIWLPAILEFILD